MNVPRIAHFYWDQGEENMPWMRRCALTSFKKCNPEWEVRVHNRSDAPEIDGDAPRMRVLRSDLARYRALARDGGFYFDTDIVFFGAIPEEWLHADVLATVDDFGNCFAIASLGASPDNRFFRRMELLATERIKAKQRMLVYQSLGTLLWTTCGHIPTMVSGMNLRWRRIPNEAFLPIQWCNVGDLWSEVPLDPMPHSLGLHWFGGDEITREFEALLHGPDDAAKIDRPVTQFLLRYA